MAFLLTSKILKMLNKHLIRMEVQDSHFIIRMTANLLKALMKT